MTHRLIICFSLFLLISTPGLAQMDLTVTGAGTATADGLYDEVGSAGGKAQFQQAAVHTFYVEWTGSQWELYNTADGFTYYTNPMDTPLPPREQWVKSKGALAVPTLSGIGTVGPLHGTYTIGGSSPSFHTIIAAVDSLNSDGISDNVTFELRSGLYDQQVEIEFFPNYGNAADSVTFVPESGVLGNVEWRFMTTPGASNNYFARIDSARNITFDRIEFSVLSTETTYGKIIEVDDAENLLILNCELIGVADAALTDDLNLIDSNTDLRVIGNVLTNGSIAVDFRGAGLIDGNTIQQQTQFGVFIDQAGAVVSNNTISDYSGSTSGYTGVVSSGDAALIERNIIRVSYGQFGIEVPRFHATIQNNMIGMDSPGSSTDAGISVGRLVGDPASADIRFNTIAVSLTTGPAVRMHRTLGSDLHNNLLLNGAAGIVLDFPLQSPALLSSDFNNLNTVGATLVDGPASCCATLADWQAESHHPDPNSVNKATTLQSFPTNLHLSGAAIGDNDLAGTPYGGVTTDIDGDTRSATAPYMGADEASTPLSLGISVDLSAFLEGSFSTGSMSTALNSGGHLSDSAIAHPYGGPPWNYPGTESVVGGYFAANPTVVDWVLVRLYNGTLPVIVPAYSAVGLLLSDGSIVRHSNTSLDMAFDVAAGSYYVAVLHRNHLGIISSSKVDLSVASPSYNFTTGSGQAYSGGSPPQAVLTGGVFGLFASDGSKDGQITANDFNAWLIDTKASATGYLASDFNMDGQVTASDFNFWLANTKVAATSQIP